MNKLEIVATIYKMLSGKRGKADVPLGEITLALEQAEGFLVFEGSSGNKKDLQSYRDWKASYLSRYAGYKNGEVYPHNHNWALRYTMKNLLGIEAVGAIEEPQTPTGRIIADSALTL